MPEVLDDKKITFIVLCTDEKERQRQVDFMRKIQFRLPSVFNKFNFEIRFDIISGNLAKTCNRVLKENNAKYKIFLTTPVVTFTMELIFAMVWKFFEYPKVGMLGLFGSELPISGDYTKARNFYGVHRYSNDSKEIKLRTGKMPVFYQSVHIIDPGIFVTSENILFDEMVGDDFFIAAQSCRYRRAGYDVGVMYVEGVPLIFSEDKFIYQPKDDVDSYNEKLKQFVTLYKDIVTPLVSVCIPTYNQPHFFEIALQSALNQTYPNIEIIVGDDSTNEDTKKMIQPYLAQHSNIKYFHHGKPLGKKGGVNTTFTINKSSGEYINVLFHDDVIGAEKISRMMEYFIRDLNNRITLVVSARLEINEKGQTIRRMNPWQPLEDTVISGEEVGRRILFAKSNFLGELSTSLIKRSSLLSKDPDTGEEIFDIGIFCGVKDVAYGDFGTWLNLLKYGGECVFIKDSLSAFRRHSAQNTDDYFIRVRLLIEMFSYITIAWLNNVYLKNFDEYKFCCQNWVVFFDTYYPPKKQNYDELDDIKFFSDTMFKLRGYILENKFPEVLDCSISLLLDVLEEKNAIRPLVRQNKKNGLWEKANDGIMLHGDQRC